MKRSDLGRPVDAAPRNEPSTEVVRAQARPSPRANAACLVQIYPTNEGIGTRFAVDTEPLLIGRDPKCHILIDDEDVSRFHAHLVRKDSNYFLSDYRSTNGTFVNDEPVFLRQLNDGDYLRVGRHIFRFLGGDNVEALFHEEISRLVVTDALTGIANRRALMEFLDRELGRAIRYSRPLSLLMIDIDHFKAVNDARGHLAGDVALRDLAGRMSVTIRKEEMLGRYGGEEFALVLPECTQAQACQVGDRLRMLIAGAPFKYLDKPFRLTVSIGAATTNGAETTALDLVDRADAALYLAKQEGRNRVVGEE